MKKSKDKIKLRFHFVFDDWRDKHDLSKSVYNTQTGVELSMSSFHHGTMFDGTIEVNEDEARFLQGTLKDGWLPVFVMMDPATKNWRWK